MAFSLNLEDPLVLALFLLVLCLGVMLPVVYLLARRRRAEKESRLLQLQESRRLRREGRHPEQLQARSGVTAAYQAAKDSETADRERLAALTAAQRPEPIGPQGPSADASGPRLVSTVPPGGERVGGPVRLRADQTEGFAPPVVDREAGPTASVRPPPAAASRTAAPVAAARPVAVAAAPVALSSTAAVPTAVGRAGASDDEELTTLLSTLEDLSH